MGAMLPGHMMKSREPSGGKVWGEKTRKRKREHGSHQPTHSLSTSLLQMLGWLPDEKACFNQMLGRQKPGKTRAVIGVCDLQRK